MIDREKVIKGLETCIKHIDREDCPTDCPYHEICRKYEGRVVFQPVLRDALALLKDHAEDNNVPSKWVSVKERLPKSCGNYLVYVGKDGFNLLMKTAYWLPGKKIWKGAEAYSVFTDVTHWMPLPEPPKEVDE